jgi:hypothetical protein
MLVDVLYLPLFLIIGAIMGIVALLYLFGPYSRTAGLANMFNQPLVAIPRASRIQEVKRIREIDEKGNYVIKQKLAGGKFKKLVYLIDPRNVFIAGRTRITTVLEKFGKNVAPEEAYLAELKEAGYDDAKITIDGRSISWATLQRQNKEWLGPDHVAGLQAAAENAAQQFVIPKETQLTKGGMLKFGIIIAIIVVAIVAVVLLHQFKII